jgi:hypothetical protein
MKKWLVLLFLLCVSPCWADGLVIGWPAGGGGGYATPAFKTPILEGTLAVETNPSLTGTVNVASGDLIIVQYQGTVASTGVTVGSDALTLIKRITAEGYSVELWYKENASANAAATTTITTSGSNYASATVALYSNIAISGALDKSSCNSAACDAQTDSATTWTAQNVSTTAQSDELLVFIGVGWDDHTSHTAGNGYTKRTADGTKTYVLADTNVTSTGTPPGGTVITVNDAGDDGYYSIFATFKAKAN